ncbi:hypothetical protein HS141_16780, partial [Cetobacterium somerae]|uniref:tRNA ligase subunit PheS family protein n=1 Tax=Cetobacterium somerae TaxID=188913 RepID=UPI00216BE737|nr:hypothetical protein [Cetobacterium somerae]
MGSVFFPLPLPLLPSLSPLSSSPLSPPPLFPPLAGFLVGPAVSFAPFTALFEQFVPRVFGAPKVRFRPPFFPFPEPRAALAVHCVICPGDGCSLCPHRGWLALLGCGLVAPAVLDAVG